jgi:hypothetical protein
MEHSYSIYGLRLQADRSLPGLTMVDDDARTDVEVWMRGVPDWAASAAAGTKRIRFDSGDARSETPASIVVSRYVESGAFQFNYADGVEFLIEERGRRISVTCKGSATLQDAASYLVGVILGFALRLRGRIALHASVVAIDDHAVLLLGEAGSGKSTTAAAFALMGHEILADDVCVPVESGGEFWAEPAYPGIRLWPDVVDTMFGSHDALPRITPAWDKRFLDLTAETYRFHSKRLPIGALYWLVPSHGSERSPHLRELRASERMMKLVNMSYPDYLLDSGMKSHEFDTLGRLATMVPGREVEVLHDLHAVPEICRAIIENFRQRKHRN